MVVGMAFLANNPLIVLFAGLMYIIETASVMLQTTYFKFTRIFCGEGRRIFKMSPIHHHFEMCGWKEVKIVLVFSAVSVVMCVLAWIGIQGKIG
jgi:phospho-N-acetylmuramoyl-pentapeptide-transferase